MVSDPQIYLLIFYVFIHSLVFLICGTHASAGALRDPPRAMVSWSFRPLRARSSTARLLSDAPLHNVYTEISYNIYMLVFKEACSFALKAFEDYNDIHALCDKRSVKESKSSLDF
jgi:hypothetical protein